MTTERQHTDAAKTEQLRGHTLVSADGKSLGVVKDTHGSYLQIDPSRGREYWIATEHVAYTEAEAVTVAFDKGDIDDYKLEEPGIEPSEDPFRAIAEDSIVAPEEQLEQRVRMERELAEQRQRLPHAHPAGEDAPPETAGVMGTVGEPVESELPRLERQIPEQPDRPHEFASDQRAASHTGAIVPPADRVAETLNKPITNDGASPDARPGDPTSLVAGDSQQDARERWHAPEYGQESGSGDGIRAAALAVIAATGVFALIAFFRRRSHRRRA